MGYYRAGFDIVGVDIKPQPRYPFRFIQADALDILAAIVKAKRDVGAFNGLLILGINADVIHASPPCQAHTMAQRIRGNEHSDLIELTRDLLRQASRHYVIENVPGAPLINPVELCGEMFGLRTYRHRLFETSFALVPPKHPEHSAKTTKMGRPPQDGEHMHIVGNFSGVGAARRVMEMPWASRDGLREAIPPAYTEFIGKQLTSLLSAFGESA